MRFSKGQTEPQKRNLTISNCLRYQIFHTSKRTTSSFYTIVPIVYVSKVSLGSDHFTTTFDSQHLHTIDHSVTTIYHDASLCPGLFFSFLLADPAWSAMLSRRGVCTVSGCNGEICAMGVHESTCSLPICAVSCLTQFGTCQLHHDQTGKYLCGWNTSTAEQEYQACLAA
jgi:hypothetical protein